MLLVDDNPMHQMLTTALLKERGHVVTPAADGVEALELFEAGAFDLVLLDLNMPRLNGFETARGIRKLEVGRLRRVPIVAVTSLSSEQDRERCFEVGMDDHVTKPIDPAMLDAAIAAHLRDDPPDFQLARALERTSGDEDALASVVRLFLEETPARLEALHRALDTGDAEMLGTTAFTIEDRAHQLAMPRLRDIAHRIAVVSGQGDFDQAARLTEELETAFGRGTSEIARVMGGA